MQDSDKEIVRQVISSILERLDGGASNHNGGGDNPVVLVVMGHGLNASSARAGDAHEEKAQVVDWRGMQATHPVFEKFPIAEVETVSPAPKSCFMEPGRVCVNSGACEMRGY